MCCTFWNKKIRQNVRTNEKSDVVEMIWAGKIDLKIFVSKYGFYANFSDMTLIIDNGDKKQKGNDTIQYCP